MLDFPGRTLEKNVAAIANSRVIIQGSDFQQVATIRCMLADFGNTAVAKMVDWDNEVLCRASVGSERSQGSLLS